MNGDEDCPIWEGIVDGYELRRATVPLPEDQGDKNAFPFRSWQGWANIAEDLDIPSDYPAFRARQVVKIALKASEDNIKGRYLNSAEVDAAITAIVAGDIAAAQLPETQAEQDEPHNAPIIVLDEHTRRGKRSEHNYFVMFPGQSQDQGEWFTKGQLKTNFPSTWKTMIDSWKSKKGGGVLAPSGEEETTTVGGSVQEGGGGEQHGAGDDVLDGVGGGGPGEHQASVIQGESNNPLEQPPQYQQQRQQKQRQEVSDRLPSPRLLAQPEVAGARAYDGRANQTGQVPRVQLYPQAEGHLQGVLVPFTSENDGLFIPRDAAVISPTGQIQWHSQQQPALRIISSPAPNMRASDLLTRPPGFNNTQNKPLSPYYVSPGAAGAGGGGKKRNLPMAVAPLPPALPRSLVPRFNSGVKIHPLLRKNIAFAGQNQQASWSRPLPQRRRSVQDPPAAARNAVTSSGEAAALETLETLGRRETTEEVEERKRRRVVVQGPSRNPKGRVLAEEAQPVTMTRAAAAAAAAVAAEPEQKQEPKAVEEEEEAPDEALEMMDDVLMPNQEEEAEADEEAVEIVNEAMPLPDTEDEGEHEEQETEPVEQEEELAEFEKEPGLSDEERQKRKTLRLHLTPESWSEAKIIGAKHTGECLDVFVKWKDGFTHNFPSKWLLGPNLVHCMYTLIDFYESKTKKKPLQDAAAAAAGAGGSKETKGKRKRAAEEGADGGDREEGGEEDVGRKKQVKRRSKRNAPAAAEEAGDDAAAEEEGEDDRKNNKKKKQVRRTSGRILGPDGKKDAAPEGSAKKRTRKRRK